MTHSIAEIIQNPVFIVSFIAWFLAQTLKVPVHYLLEKEWKWRQMWNAGGNPSSHTAVMVTTTIMIGITEGFSSSLFALSFAISCIVMYDATGVRYETGKQATIINQILHDVLIDGKPISDEQLKEVIGHKPVEVLSGALLGFIVSLVYLLFVAK